MHAINFIACVQHAKHRTERNIYLSMARTHNTDCEFNAMGSVGRVAHLPVGAHCLHCLEAPARSGWSFPCRSCQAADGENPLSRPKVRYQWAAAAVLLQCATWRRCPQVALVVSLLLLHLLAHVAAPADRAGDATLMLLREVHADVQMVPMQEHLHPSRVRA
jgi:hypothetical protein